MLGQFFNVYLLNSKLKGVLSVVLRALAVAVGQCV